MKKLIRFALDSGSHGTCASVGLLVLRLVSGGIMLLGHGWGKLSNFSEMSGKFGDPIGIGSAPSLALAVGAEFFCAIAVVLGLFTRLAAIPLLITMLVAAFLVHGNALIKEGELALLYAAAFTLLICTGAGKFSVDGVLRK